MIKLTDAHKIKIFFTIFWAIIISFTIGLPILLTIKMPTTVLMPISIEVQNMCYEIHRQEPRMTCVTINN